MVIRVVMPIISALWKRFLIKGIRNIISNHRSSFPITHGGKPIFNFATNPMPVTRSKMAEIATVIGSILPAFLGAKKEVAANRKKTITRLRCRNLYTS